MASKIEKLGARLTGDQITAAELLAVNKFLPKEDRKSIGDIAAASNVSERSLYNWRTNNEDFIEYVNLRAIQVFNSHLPDFMEKHMEMALKGQGSMKGIELFYKFGGYLVDKTEDITERGDHSKESLEERLERLRNRRKDEE